MKFWTLRRIRPIVRSIDVSLYRLSSPIMSVIPRSQPCPNPPRNSNAMVNHSCYHTSVRANAAATSSTCLSRGQCLFCRTAALPLRWYFCLRICATSTWFFSSLPLGAWVLRLGKVRSQTRGVNARMCQFRPGGPNEYENLPPLIEQLPWQPHGPVITDSLFIVAHWQNESRPSK